MMKRINLFSGLLAASMLFGTGMSVLMSHTQVQAASETTASNQNELRNRVRSQSNSRSRTAVPKSSFKLIVNEQNAKFNKSTGMLSGISQEWAEQNLDQIESLMRGGQLVLPDKIDGVPVKTIGEDDPDNPSMGAFSIYTFSKMLGDNHNIEEGQFVGITTVSGGTNITHLEDSVFSGNSIKTISDMVNLQKIDFLAFGWNRLKQLDLPHVTEIDSNAFWYNDLTQLNLPRVSKIGDNAFGGNKLMRIKLPANVRLDANTFSSQFITPNVTANKDGEVSFDAIKPQLKIGDVDQIKKIANIDVLSETDITVDNDKLVGVTGTDPINLNLKIDLEMVPGSRGDYSIGLEDIPLTINPFRENNNSGGSTGTEIQPDNNTNGSDNNNEVHPLPDPDKEAAAPYSVYALRGMRLHKNVSLTDPVRSYKKQVRAKAANFRIEGVAYDQNGKKRYKVKGGYITASSKYVADSHFRSKKINRVRVISNKANSYKDLKLSKNQKVRSYKKGTKLNVKRIVNYGRTTRFELANGRYISGNKQIFIMDQK